jgi:Ca2+-binding EF-hand superfamily protein
MFNALVTIESKDLGQEMIDQILNEVDANGDGQIDFEEFCAVASLE